MTNKTLATINLLCIAFPMGLGALEVILDRPLTNGGLVALAGLFMIFFGIWTSLRLAKQPD
jgi:hypothetical protein|tara:strand:- start:152 stop:334 length:183 start_codon:yes stop_codon:yes gene_type:complete